MSERPPGIRRLCIAMEIDGGAGQTPGVIRPWQWRRDLSSVIGELGRVATLDRAHWNPPVAGGGEIALLPPGIDEGSFVATFVAALRSVVARLNDGMLHTERLRLRVALHQGITHLDESGFSGRAVVKVAALRDCAELRAELRRQPSADLALAVSGALFDDVVEHDYPGLRGRDFRPQRVGLTTGPGADAWFLTPGLAEAPAPTVAPARPAILDVSGRPRPQSMDQAASPPFVTRAEPAGPNPVAAS